ncbi:MAG: efflux RND transporter periplasmic adaptor subunit, partial [Mesorhizobium sp.]
MSRNATPSVRPLPVNALKLLSFPGSTMLACALAALSLAGCQKQEAAAKKLPIMVRAETVRIADYAPRTSLTGVIAARTLNNLSFRVGGRIAERLVDVGQHVDKDAVLA